MEGRALSAALRPMTAPVDFGRARRIYGGMNLPPRDLRKSAR
jgi:hypothetical protein